MIYEAAEIITGLLEDAAFGVNAKLDSIPSSDEIGPIPRVAKVYNSFRNPELGTDSMPDDRLALVVAVDQPAMTRQGAAVVAQRHREADVVVSIYVVVGQADIAQARAEALTVARAVLASLQHGFRNENQKRRSIRDVTVTSASSIVFGETRFEDSMAAVKAGIDCTLTVRDHAP